ncbi:hypothetical protein CDAR_51901 [Caerostris darwini]|uniref:Uncharacterized protein n=1 Tax=Caerostris darwini TaxID=1538125 RepID=A0AAV4X3I4_9ARAC|nr:hypothetical protein CDAR_51901 [Caerostris darwini]
MVSLFNFLERSEGDDTRTIKRRQHLHEAVRARGRNGAEQGLIVRDHQGAPGNGKNNNKRNKRTNAIYRWRILLLIARYPFSYDYHTAVFFSESVDPAGKR